MIPEGIVREDDLITDESGQQCLTLRFKNSTGNIIDLSSKPRTLTQSELDSAFLV